jgi:hypothetical protein
VNGSPRSSITFDALSMRLVLGLAAACLAVLLLKPA